MAEAAAAKPSVGSLLQALAKSGGKAKGLVLDLRTLSRPTVQLAAPVAKAKAAVASAPSDPRAAASPAARRAAAAAEPPKAVVVASAPSRLAPTRPAAPLSPSSASSVQDAVSTNSPSCGSSSSSEGLVASDASRSRDGDSDERPLPRSAQGRPAGSQAAAGRAFNSLAPSPAGTTTRERGGREDVPQASKLAKLTPRRLVDFTESVPRAKHLSPARWRPGDEREEPDPQTERSGSDADSVPDSGAEKPELQRKRAALVPRVELRPEKSREEDKAVDKVKSSKHKRQDAAIDSPSKKRKGDSAGDRTDPRLAKAATVDAEPVGEKKKKKKKKRKHGADDGEDDAAAADPRQKATLSETVPDAPGLASDHKEKKKKKHKKHKHEAEQESGSTSQKVATPAKPDQSVKPADSFWGSPSATASFAQVAAAPGIDGQATQATQAADAGAADKSHRKKRHKKDKSASSGSSSSGEKRKRKKHRRRRHGKEAIRPPDAWTVWPPPPGAVPGPRPPYPPPWGWPPGYSPQSPPPGYSAPAGSAWGQPAAAVQTGSAWGQPVAAAASAAPSAPPVAASAVTPTKVASAAASETSPDAIARATALYEASLSEAGVPVCSPEKKAESPLILTRVEASETLDKPWTDDEKEEDHTDSSSEAMIVETKVPDVGSAAVDQTLGAGNAKSDATSSNPPEVATNAALLEGAQPGDAAAASVPENDPYLMMSAAGLPEASESSDDVSEAGDAAEESVGVAELVVDPVEEEAVKVPKTPKQPPKPLDSSLEAWQGPSKTGWEAPQSLELDTELSQLATPEGVVSVVSEIDRGCDVDPSKHAADASEPTESREARKKPPPFVKGDAEILQMPLWGVVGAWAELIAIAELEPILVRNPAEVKSVERRKRRLSHTGPGAGLYDADGNVEVEPNPASPDESLQPASNGNHGPIDVEATEAPAPVGKPPAIRTVSWQAPPRLELPPELVRDPARIIGTERNARATARIAQSLASQVGPGLAASLAAPPLAPPPQLSLPLASSPMPSPPMASPLMFGSPPIASPVAFSPMASSPLAFSTLTANLTPMSFSMPVVSPISFEPPGPLQAITVHPIRIANKAPPSTPQPAVPHKAPPAQQVLHHKPPPSVPPAKALPPTASEGLPPAKAPAPGKARAAKSAAKKSAAKSRGAVPAWVTNG